MYKRCRSFDYLFMDKTLENIIFNVCCIIIFFFRNFATVVTNWEYLNSKFQLKLINRYCSLDNQSKCYQNVFE